MTRQYITTAIDYPNAAPHMGHVLEKVLADVCARWFRLRGDDVLFQIGTDEHGIKIQQTAQKEGVTPRELVDRNVPLFRDLYARLGVSADRFIRTSDQETHWPTVVALWRKLRQTGALEKRSYAGLYCSGCERFVTKKDLVDGKCPDHQRVPDEVTEENWFFLLSKQSTALRELLTKDGPGAYRIVPDFRAQETLSLIDSGLEDVSFSRPVSSLSWGVPVPDEEGQTMYVWCDALTNYISGLGLLTEKEEREWWDQAEVTHVIGKDIARFHALIWPAMLREAGIRTPDRLLIHGFLTSEGQKMSKSLGNVVAPDAAVSRYGVDALRFYLSHEIPVGNDGDFSWKRFQELYDSKLRNQLGNLLNRVLVMIRKAGGGLVAPETDDAGWAEYAAALDRFDVTGALHHVMRSVDKCNKLMDVAKPWALPESEKILVLSGLAEHLRHIALMLLPFTPDTARSMARQLGLPDAEAMGEKGFVLTDAHRAWRGQPGWIAVGEPAILFPPVEVAAES